MADSTSKSSLKLVFLAEDASKVTFNVASPKEDITPSEVVNAMNIIIDNNVFANPGGDLVSRHSAYKYTTSTSDINIGVEE